MSDILSSALDLAQRGMHLFPVDHPGLPKCAGVGKGHDPATCVERGKHPTAKWSEAATNDPAAIAAALNGALRNIGISCGPSRLVVIDEDVPGDFTRFCRDKGQQVPETFTVSTGKGSHFYFRQPAGRMLTNEEGELRRYGCNVRGSGGYVVGPGSTHASGNVYRAVNPGTAIKPCPDWLADAVQRRGSTPEAPSPIRENGTRQEADTDQRGWWREGTVPEGKRHDALVAAAGWCRERGLSRREALPVVRDVFTRLAAGKYTWEHALGTLTDCYARYPDGPERRLRQEVDEQRLRRQARRILDAEDRPAAEIPEVLTLAERLARPRPQLVYRIEGWQPAGGRVMLAAQYKAGKTTLTGNLARSLVDGAPFLGRHTATALTGTLVLLDFEMTARQLDTWLSDQRIGATGRVIVLPMRGHAAAFDIIDPAVRQRWVSLLRERSAEYLVLDCLRPVLDALGLDEHRDAGRFLVALDALLADAGIGEACVVHHMGHNGERARGDSRIRDWPDVEWRLVRQDEQPDSPRYLSAFGRDVDQAESLLSFDPTTRRLSLVGGSRKGAAVGAAVTAVLRLLTDEPGLSGRKVEEALSAEHGQKVVRAALALTVKDGTVTRRPATGRSGFSHFRTLETGSSASVRQSASDAATRPGGECVSASIGTHARTVAADTASASPETSDPLAAVEAPEPGTDSPKWCAVPGCRKPARAACLTCADHMTREMEYA